MAKTRSNQTYSVAKRTKGLYPTLAELRAYTRVIFQEEVVVHEQIWPLDHMDTSLVERSIRFPAALKRSLVKRQVLENVLDFYLTHNIKGSIQCSVTANIILQGNVESDKSYSIMYGQDYSEEYGDRYCLEGGVVEVENAQQAANKIPFDFADEDVIEGFNRAYRHSNVRVHALVNYVYILRYIQLN